MGYGLSGVAIGLTVLAAAADAQVRLNHGDILGRWCGAAAVWQIGRQQLVIVRRGDKRRTTVPVRYFTFGVNRVTLHGADDDGGTTQMHLLNLQPLGPSFRHLKSGIFRRC